MSFTVSNARADITPQAGQPMGGYGTETAPRVAAGTYAPLTARAVVIWDAGTPRVLVALDVLAIPPSVDANIRSQLTLPAADLILLASHTHNGPALSEELDPYIAYNITDTSAVDGYTGWLASTIVGLVGSALAAPQTTVTLDYQVTSQSWSHNRAGLSYVETAVPVVVARDTTGQPVVVLYSYGCHPVSAGQQTRWDGDYPAVASAVVEATIPGCTAVYLPGPAGDQNPTGTAGWPLRDRLGAQLGDAVVTAATTAGRTLSGPISTSTSTTSLPLDITPTPANLAAVRADYVARSTDTTHPAWYRRHGERMVTAIDAGTYTTAVTVPVTRWRLAGTPQVQLCWVGGELVSGYAVWARNTYGGTAGLLIGGYAGGCSCYLPSNELLAPIKAGGSYEGGWDIDYPGVAGGSMTVYPHLGHFKAGTGGVESALTAAITAQLT